MLAHMPTKAKLIVDGAEYPCAVVSMTQGTRFGDFVIEAKAIVSGVEQDRKRDTKTASPPALLAEGNTSDRAWVDESATYSAVLTARNGKKF
jgi:hypothetical protein